jgi:hypothetical protein
MKPLFISGPPRSGTSILTVVLNEHPDVSITNEQSYMKLMMHCLSELNPRGRAEQGANFNFFSVPKEQLGDVRDMILEGMDHSMKWYHNKVKPKAKWYGDKLPGFLQHIGWMKEKFPDAKFLICERDPEEVLVSMKKYTFSDVFTEEQVEEGFKVYMESLEKNRGRRDCLYVKLEDQKKNPEDTYERIAEFLDIENDFNLSMISRS